MRDQYFSERDIAYRVNEFQIGRPTLLLLHGLSGSLSAWDPYIEGFQQDFNILTLDLRGHGCSKRWRRQGDYVLQEFVDDIAALVRTVVRGPVTLVAHSFTAIVARELVRQQAFPIEGIVFLAPAYRIRRSRMARLLLPGLALFCKLIAVLPQKKAGTRLDYRIFYPSSDWDIRRMRADISATGLQGYLWTLYELYQYPDQPWRELADKPLLVVHGTHDRFVPVSHSSELVRDFSAATLELLPGANHMLVINNVPEVIRYINVWMKR